MKILFLTRYTQLGASSRLRAYQYLPYFESKGFEVTVAPLLGDEYLRGLYKGNIPILSVLRAYIARVGLMLRANTFDLLWIEKELFPWVPDWLEFVLLPKGVPIVVDFDDALFHQYEGHRFRLVRAMLGRKIDAVMKLADLVVVGNDYLRDRAQRAGARRIELLPTVVDICRYTVSSGVVKQPVTIGWIGSPSTVKYLQLILPILQSVIASRGIRVVAVGANPEQLAGLPIKVKPWSEKSEVEEIQQFDIGIMPLSDEPWERGKCGYKLIQYMACGKPVVASPVGINLAIVRHGINGFLAENPEEWIQALECLCDDPVLRHRMGDAGRKRVELEYSLEVTEPKFEILLRSVART
jgi:glycosyltransferase involved in cell wall biosynthesis